MEKKIKTWSTFNDGCANLTRETNENVHATHAAKRARILKIIKEITYRGGGAEALRGRGSILMPSPIPSTLHRYNS
jgi:hypothetical protein